jgi:hypothetical protein
MVVATTRSAKLTGNVREDGYTNARVLLAYFKMAYVYEKLTNRQVLTIWVLYLAFDFRQAAQ